MNFKSIALLSLLLSLLFVMMQLRLYEMVMYFILVGEIPMTNIRLEPSTTLAVLTSATLIALFHYLSSRVSLVRKLRDQIMEPFIVTTPKTR